MRELARAAILALPPPQLPLAARWHPGVGGNRGPPPCPHTQGDGAPLKGRERSGRGRLLGVELGDGVKRRAGKEREGRGEAEETRVDPW